MIIKEKTKNRKFNLILSRDFLKNEIQELPDNDTVYKMVSFGDFSSASFMSMIADLTHIRTMYCSTLHIGKKELGYLVAANANGQLDKVIIAMMSPYEKTDDYGYGNIIKTVFDEHPDWEIRCLKNHSKVHLYDTDLGKFVLETSSNLNENPKVEQYSFEKSEELFEFYKKYLFERETNEQKANQGIVD